MATTSTSDSRDRSRSNSRSRSSSRNGRGRSRNSNNRGRSGGGGGGGGGRNRPLDDNRPYRVTRPKKKPSLWARILGIFGIGKKTAAPKKRASTSQSTRRPREEKRHEPVELTAPRLFVGNLSYDATDSDIENLLNGIGQVKSAEIVTNQRTQRSKGFAFVEMLSLDDAKRAIEVLHNEQFLGRRLIVSPAKSEGVHPNVAGDNDEA